jgi:hypothetical protein
MRTAQQQTMKKKIERQKKIKKVIVDFGPSKKSIC